MDNNAAIIRLLLVDDHNLFRSGIRSLLQRYPQFQIVGEAGDGNEGLNRAVELKPDVVLQDLHMPGLSGAETTRLILEEVPDTQVLILTVSEETDDLVLALRAGACGYLLKNIEAEALVAAVRAAAAGESVISPAMLGKLLGSLKQDGSCTGRPPRAPADGKDRLTPREREILLFLARGMSNKEIARKLDLAESTVKIHVQNTLRKLNLSSRVQAAVYAVENGFAPGPGGGETP